MPRDDEKNQPSTPTPEERAAGRRQIIIGLVIGVIVGGVIVAITGEWPYIFAGLGIGLISGLMIRPSSLKQNDEKNGSARQRRR